MFALVPPPRPVNLRRPGPSIGRAMAIGSDELWKRLSPKIRERTRGDELMDISIAQIQCGDKAMSPRAASTQRNANWPSSIPLFALRFARCCASCRTFGIAAFLFDSFAQSFSRSTPTRRRFMRNLCEKLVNRLLMAAFRRLLMGSHRN